MLDTLITLLQQESERICGKALPVEMCRKILIEYGGMVSPTAIAWKGMDWLPRLKLDLVRLKWRRFNAAVAQKRKENCPHTSRTFLGDVCPREVGDHRFWVKSWAWWECIHTSNERGVQEAEAAAAATDDA